MRLNEQGRGSDPSEDLGLIGACGDHCELCPRRLAIESGSDDALIRLKELWVSFGWRDPGVDPRSLACGGCTPDNPCAYREARDCAFAKGLSTCGSCPDYPCPAVEGVFARSELTLAALPEPLLCTPVERDLLFRAFFRKREILNTVNRSVSLSRTRPCPDNG